MMKLLLVLILMAAPLSAQLPERITLERPEVNIDLPPMEITNEINVLTDSTMMARFNENMERSYAQREEQECSCGGATTTAKLTLGILGPLLTWIAISLHRSANKNDSHTVDVDNAVEVNVPPHDHGDRQPHGDNGESES